MERMRYFVLKGKVQGVMCRQTLMRGAQKRDLDAGATNEANGEVTLTLSGDNDKVCTFQLNHIAVQMMCLSVTYNVAD